MAEPRVILGGPASPGSTSIAIAAYLGSSDAFDRAVAAFADAYADRNERDYASFVQAVSEGRMPAAPGG